MCSSANYERSDESNRVRVTRLNVGECIDTAPVFCSVGGTEIDCGSDWQDLAVSLFDYLLPKKFPRGINFIATEKVNEALISDFLLLSKPTRNAEDARKLQCGCWLNLPKKLPALIYKLYKFCDFCGVQDDRFQLYRSEDPRVDFNVSTDYSGIVLTRCVIKGNNVPIGETRRDSFAAIVGACLKNGGFRVKQQFEGALKSAVGTPFVQVALPRTPEKWRRTPTGHWVYVELSETFFIKKLAKLIRYLGWKDNDVQLFYKTTSKESSNATEAAQDSGTPFEEDMTEGSAADALERPVKKSVDFSKGFDESAKKLLEDVLLKEFSSGFDLNSPNHLTKLRRALNRKRALGVDSVLDRQLLHWMRTLGALFRGIVYPLTETSRNLAINCVKDAFATGARIVFYSALFSRRRSDFISNSIVDSELFAHLIQRYLCGKGYVLAEEYCEPTAAPGTLEEKIVGEIMRVWGTKRVALREDVFEALPFIPYDKIRETIDGSDLIEVVDRDYLKYCGDDRSFDDDPSSNPFNQTRLFNPFEFVVPEDSTETTDASETETVETNAFGVDEDKVDAYEEIVVDFNQPERYAGTVPVSCTIDGKTLDFNGGWRELFVAIANYGFEKRPAMVKYLLTADLGWKMKTPFLRREPFEPRYFGRLLKIGYWIYVNLSIPSFVKKIAMLCQNCGVEIGDVKIVCVLKTEQSAKSKYLFPSLLLDEENDCLSLTDSYRGTLHKNYEESKEKEQTTLLNFVNESKVSKVIEKELEPAQRTEETGRISPKSKNDPTLTVLENAIKRLLIEFFPNGFMIDSVEQMIELFDYANIKSETAFSNLKPENGVSIFFINNAIKKVAKEVNGKYYITERSYV